MFSNYCHSGEDFGVAAGKVDIRVTKKTGKARLRFYGVAPDHLEIILLALEKARGELDTVFDTVAMEAICLSYLSGNEGSLSPDLLEGILNVAE